MFGSAISMYFTEYSELDKDSTLFLLCDKFSVVLQVKSFVCTGTALMVISKPLLLMSPTLAHISLYG